MQVNSYTKLWEGVKAGESDFDCIVERKDKTNSQPVNVVWLLIEDYLAGKYP
ncbi:hypothetical protein [Candidatus Cardinium hertigii]|uniref:hypothetical protein n=1 Tax=Candidatus Cardinium hertigii TaxID=247481 RepID=UPI0013A562AB|nr:hypothetical protein [Candidatus Cardinium hertigii]